MARHWGVNLWTGILIGFSGCAGEDAANSTNSSPPPATLGPSAAPANSTAAPPAETKPSATAFDIQTLIPKDIEIAAGLKVAEVSTRNFPYSEQLLEPFRPVLAMLEGLGIKASQVGELWCGTIRSQDSVIICVQSTVDLVAGRLRQRLQGIDQPVKAGMRQVYPFSHVTGVNNAFALVNSRTLLIGRYETVVAALGNPERGSIRAGNQALQQPQAFFWVAGLNDDTAGKLHLGGRAGRIGFVDAAPKPRGTAICLTLRQNDVPIEVRVAWSFNSPVASGQMAGLLEAQMKAIEAAQKAATSGGGPTSAAPPAGTPNAGGPSAGGPSAGARPAGGPNAGGPNAPAAPVSGAPGRGPAAGPPVAPNGPQGMGQAANASVYKTELEGLDLRLIYHISKEEAGTVAKLLGRVMAASGVSALDDGLFTGTLASLNSAIRAGEQAPADQRAGMKKVIQHPWAPAWSHYSWMTALLPHIGYGSTYEKFDFSNSWSVPFNLPYAATVVSPFLNPADARSVWDGLGPPLGATHFAGMSGIEDGRNVIAADLPRSDPHAGIFGYD
jgi:hypothetical protein